MKIAIVGSGYVGLVSGICFANLGHEVFCVDKDLNKINQLKSGNIPIFEPKLKELLAEVLKSKKISFYNNLQEPLDNCEVVFIAVGTPQGEDGSADLSYVLDVAKEVAEISSSYKLIITKSTVPAGTGAKIKNLITTINPNLNFSVASNPEFLREGMAINDFLEPDRIVIGFEDEKSEKLLEEIYQKFPANKLVKTDIITAELIKYASNSFLATKIAFINEMSDLCESVGGDIKKLSFAMGADSRIGHKFLNPGPGFGGSCFPKDIMAILNIGIENNVDLSLVNSVVASNKNRKAKMVDKISKILDGNLLNKKIAVLGLAFKANTDDIRYSPAISIVKKLSKQGAKISAHDFEAINNAKKELKNFDNIEFFNDYFDSIKDCDAIVILTEWEEYKKLNFTKIKELTKSRIIIDLRNLFDEKLIEELGFDYFYVGKKK